MKVDPLIDPLRDDPRFKEMLKRLNLPERAYVQMNQELPATNRIVAGSISV